MLIDSHCHLSFKDYAEADLPEILRHASDNGVGTLINVGAGEGYEGNERALDLTKRYCNSPQGELCYPAIYATVGIHPHDAKIVTPEILEKIELLAQNPKVVAIGEIGLDFYYEHSPREVQEKVFPQFIDLALRLKKPVMIHDRSAGERTYEILRDNSPPPPLKVRGGERGSYAMIHCFTGTMELAKKYLDLGCYLSFTGIITFKKSVELREIVKMVPLERMLIETDSPYLTPEPHRGKKNEPAYVKQVAEKVAELKGISFEEVAKATSENAKRFFQIPLNPPFSKGEIDPPL